MAYAILLLCQLSYKPDQPGLIGLEPTTHRTEVTVLYAAAKPLVGNKRFWIGEPSGNPNSTYKVKKYPNATPPQFKIIRFSFALFPGNRSVLRRPFAFPGNSNDNPGPAYRHVAAGTFTFALHAGLAGTHPAAEAGLFGQHQNRAVAS